MGYCAEAKDIEVNEPTWQAVENANLILDWLKQTQDRTLWFPCLSTRRPPVTGKCSFLSVCVVSDSAFANLETKHSQGGFLILLVKVEHDVQLGGYVHILDWGSNKSTRVARSTFAAELLSATKALERAELLVSWLTEIWQGAPEGGARGQVDREAAFDMCGAIDARGVFDAITAREMGKLTDKSMVLYLAAFREAIKQKMYRFFAWIPTQSMLADCLTKDMDPGDMWDTLFKFAWWAPYRLEFLLEDLVIYDCVKGTVSRYRMES